MDAEKGYEKMTDIVDLIDKLHLEIKKNDIYEMGRTMANLNRACTELQDDFYREAYPKVVSI